MSLDYGPCLRVRCPSVSGSLLGRKRWGPVGIRHTARINLTNVHVSAKCADVNWLGAISERDVDVPFRGRLIGVTPEEGRWRDLWRED